MRFTIEQIYLTNSRGAQSVRGPEYHVVEAESLDAALHEFLTRSSAVVIGDVQKFPGFHAVATARNEESVFTVELSLGSDAFHRSKQQRP